METNDMKLLIVEDEEQVARSLKRVLAKHWNVVDIVNSAFEGIQIIENYDIILTDWDCPGKGEGEFIVETAFEHKIPCVVHTANTVKSNAIVINKPCDADEIMAALKSAVKKMEVYNVA